MEAAADDERDLAAGDAGGALGAALSVWYQHLGNPRSTVRVCGGGADGMKGSFLGPSYSDGEIEAFLEASEAPHRLLPRQEVIEKAARALANEKVVGWFQGRMEFGPRALGARSILGNPQSSKMQSLMNLKIKFRESFRPFAPSVLREAVADYFELDCDSPYMLLVAAVRHDLQIPVENIGGEDLIETVNQVRSSVPAVTHVDYSARIQTVSAHAKPDFYQLIQEHNLIDYKI